MKPVSTGTGLIVLSATIAACFAVSQLESQGKAIARIEATFQKYNQDNKP